MADPHIDRLLDRLTIEFQATVAREEAEAATDLALSLAQSTSLTDRLGRFPSKVLLRDRAPLDVAAVGADYLVTSDPVYLVPIERALIRRSAQRAIGTNHEAPGAMRGSLIELLRAHGRGVSRAVVVSAGGTELSGALRLVGPDHLVIAVGADEVLVPRGSIEWILLDDAGSGE